MNVVRGALAVAAVLLGGAACGAPREQLVAVDPPSSDVALVACHADRTRVEPGTIRPRPDGVHLSVTNPSEEERLLLIEGFGSDPVPPDGAEVVTTAPPGELRVACVASEEPEDPEDSPWPYPEEDEWAALEVVDREGVWVDNRLACEHPTGEHPDYEWDLTDAPMPAGRVGDPVDLAREDLPDYLGRVGGRDVLERAGYPEAMPTQVRLVRRGAVVAIVRYQPDGQRGWHHRGVDYCDESSGDGREPTAP